MQFKLKEEEIISFLELKYPEKSSNMVVCWLDNINVMI